MRINHKNKFHKKFFESAQFTKFLWTSFSHFSYFWLVTFNYLSDIWKPRKFELNLTLYLLLASIYDSSHNIKDPSNSKQKMTMKLQSNSFPDYSDSLHWHLKTFAECLLTFPFPPTFNNSWATFLTLLSWSTFDDAPVKFHTW